MARKQKAYPDAEIPKETYEELLEAAFPSFTATQDDADTLILPEDSANLAVAADDIILAAFDFDRIAAVTGGNLELYSVAADTFSVTDAETYVEISSSEIGRILVNAGEDKAALADETEEDADPEGSEDIEEVKEKRVIYNMNNQGLDADSISRFTGLAIEKVNSILTGESMAASVK